MLVLLGDELLIDGETYTIRGFRDKESLEAELLSNLTGEPSIHIFAELDIENHISGEMSNAAGDLEVVHIAALIGTDETSCNPSKRFNLGESANYQIANVRVEDRELCYVGGIGGSIQGDWRDVMEAVLLEFQVGGVCCKGFIVYDAFRKADIFVVVSLLCTICTEFHHDLRRKTWALNSFSFSKDHAGIKGF